MDVPIVHGYGMTECPMICNGSPSDTDDQLANTEGAPIEGCAVSIVDPDTGELAGPGAEGEVRAAGPMLFKGYTDRRSKRAPSTSRAASAPATSV